MYTAVQRHSRDESGFALKLFSRLREQALAVKAQAQFICAVTRHNGRIWDFENVRSQSYSALEQFLFEIALADAGADARRGGVSAIYLRGYAPE